MAAIQVIADSGSTKTDWALLADGKAAARFTTSGINPVTMTPAQCQAVVMDEVLPQLSALGQWPQTTNAHPAVALQLHYYGAGCRGVFAQQLHETLQTTFPQVIIEVCTDLEGAARALFGRGQGIACILGTGANSGLYDGHAISDNIPPLGYILGDEGSGAALGKRFLNALYKRRLPESVEQAFVEETGLTMGDVVSRVYRQPLANRFLASLSRFIGSHLAEPSLQELVRENFRDFFRHNLRPYGCTSMPVGVVGSIGYHYQQLLRQAAADEGFSIARVVQAPMDDLIRFHTDDA